MSHKLVLSHHVHQEVHGKGLVGRFNAWLASGITKNVGTMWCAYIFTVIGATGIVSALTNNLFLTLVVGAVSGYFFQLVLLPVIMVGQNIQTAAADARAKADHDTLLAVHDKLDQLILTPKIQEGLDAAARGDVVKGDIRENRKRLETGPDSGAHI